MLARPGILQDSSNWKPDTNREGRDYNSMFKVSPRLIRLERLIGQDK